MHSEKGKHEENSDNNNGREKQQQNVVNQQPTESTTFKCVWLWALERRRSTLKHYYIEKDRKRRFISHTTYSKLVLTDKWNKLQYYFIYSNVFISFSVYTHFQMIILICAQMFVCALKRPYEYVCARRFFFMLFEKLIHSSDVVWLTRTDVTARHDLY